MYNQKNKKFTFKYDKAVASLLYVSQKVDNLYNIVKVLYFADKEHLSKYGRFIFGDTYIAMPKGHVPSNLYDMIKFVRGDGNRTFEENLKNKIKVEKNKITAIEKPNLEYLSESDIECLDKSIKDHGKATHIFLFRKSHKDEAYKKTELNEEIKLQDIIDTLPNKDKVDMYLNHMYE